MQCDGGKGKKRKYMTGKIRQNTVDKRERKENKASFSFSFIFLNCEALSQQRQKQMQSISTFLFPLVYSTGKLICAQKINATPTLKRKKTEQCRHRMTDKYGDAQIHMGIEPQIHSTQTHEKKITQNPCACNRPPTRTHPE